MALIVSLVWATYHNGSASNSCTGFHRFGHFLEFKRECEGRTLMKRSLAIGFLLFVTAWATAATRKVTIPGGTQLSVRITDKLSSGSAKVDQPFQGTLEAPVSVNGRVVFPKGAHVTGKVTAVHRSGRLSDPGVLELTLVSVGDGKNSWSLNTQPFKIKGESHAKSNVTKIGGTAAAGTILGAIFGGGKGAAIGAAAGAATGTAVAAASGKKEAQVESEAVLPFVTAGAVSGTVAETVVAQQAALPPPQAQPVERETEQMAYEGSEDSNDRGAYRRADRDDDDDDRDENRAYRRDDGDRYRRAEERERHSRRRYMEDFSDEDRRIIRSCYREDYSNLPPGLAKRNGNLPPGLARHIQRNGTLPPGLQKRVEPLSEYCTRQLPPAPDGWMPVYLSGRILLLDADYRIMDLFYLKGDD